MLQTNANNAWLCQPDTDRDSRSQQRMLRAVLVKFVRVGNSIILPLLRPPGNKFRNAACS